MLKLDEVEARRPGFVEGVRIQLADGQRWSFPRPTMTLTGDVAPGGFGPDYEAKLDTFIEADTFQDEIPALLAIGADLLLRNYALGPRHVAELIPYITEDEPSAEMWSAIADVALGRSELTYNGWIRVACLMAGLTGTVSLQDAVHVARMMTATERAIDPHRCVDWLRERLRAETHDRATSFSI